MTSTVRVLEVRDARPDGGEGLLAIVIYPTCGPAVPVGDGAVPKETFLTGPDEPQQVGVLHRPAGTVVPPHAHHFRRRSSDRTQEVLSVVRGSMAVTIYTSAGDRVDAVRATAGDVVCLFGGGHSIEFLEDTTLIEVKTGPYAGREFDKYDLPVKA